MSKNFFEELADLERGLDSINEVILKPKNTRIHQKALISRDIQQARIDFFKRGYALRDREVEAQLTLNLEAKK